MVDINLDSLVICIFGEMSLFSFVYYAMGHLEDERRTSLYLDLCDYEYRAKVIEWINRCHCYGRN